MWKKGRGTTESARLGTGTIHQALSDHERTIQLDPDFAMGYGRVASDYCSTVQIGQANEY
jgi:hypothetical protein